MIALLALAEGHAPAHSFDAAQGNVGATGAPARGLMISIARASFSFFPAQALLTRGREIVFRHVQQDESLPMGDRI